MTPPVYKTHNVFVPGGTATVTYNPRDSTENVETVETYVERSGEILVIAGPTKMGKTVLVTHVVPKDRRIWLEGSWLRSIDDFWERLGAALQIPKSKSGSTGSVKVAKWQFLSKLGFAGSGVSASIAGEESASSTSGWTEELPLDQAVTQGLVLLAEHETPFTIVIDDFHFAPAQVRTQIIQALKALVHRRVPAILITLGHRRRDASDGVRDIGGRVRTLPIQSWGTEELVVIAEKGFKALNLVDPNGTIAKLLADESYGSPQLMQALCLQLCDYHKIKQTQDEPFLLSAPTNVRAFFMRLRDEQSIGWLERLMGGATPRGKARILFPTKDGRQLNGYQLLLAAMQGLGPRLEMPLEQVRAAAANLQVTGEKPDADAVKKLGRMSKIAATSLDDIPDEEALDELEVDRQPVFEYDEKAVPPTVYIVEPYLAYALRWHGNTYLGQ